MPIVTGEEAGSGSTNDLPKFTLLSPTAQTPNCTLSKQGLASPPGRHVCWPSFPKWGQGRLVSVSSLKAGPSSSPCSFPASLPRSSLTSCGASANPPAFVKRRRRGLFSSLCLRVSKVGSELVIRDSKRYLAASVLGKPLLLWAPICQSEIWG